MPRITLQPSGKAIDVQPNTELQDAVRQVGLEIDTPCGGKGTCGNCVVRVVDGEVAAQNLGKLSPIAVNSGYVQACQTAIKQSDVTIEVPEHLGRKGGQFADTTRDLELVDGSLLPKIWQRNPYVVKFFIDVPEPRPEDGMSDLDRLIRLIQLDWGQKKIEVPLAVIRLLADSLRVYNGKVTVAMTQTSEKHTIIDLKPGDCADRNFGVAVDIGTTTISAQLVSLPQAEILASRTDYNDQISCGLDVISRINYAQQSNRLEELCLRVLDTVNRLILGTAKESGVEKEEICNAVVSGNTTMIHLLLGLPPEQIRLAPYTPTVLEIPYLPAAEIGLDIHPRSPVHLSPAIGSYVGGDITAGLLCTDLATDSGDISLFIDIGTNGELVVGNADFIMACACSAGPAFEGGGIKNGMRAARGAIERVEIEPENGTASCRTIGEIKPKGICGSGMLSLLAELFRSGWIDAAGKLERARTSPAIRFEGRQAEYVIVPAEESGLKGPIAISELEIENIVRAKAAIYSACCLMLDQVGLEMSDLAKVYIAGGFGRFLDLENAVTIGLLPDLPREKFQYLGNSSLMGSYMILISQEYRQRQLDLSRRITYLELNTDPAYMDQYTAALFLPHTDLSCFPSLKR
ncbi:MAG: DUF4445 domain-containing protein [Proteobacteria bacterium]|nr:DUF4445 domain-containing protein [Pseudomonadota bacterium]